MHKLATQYKIYLEQTVGSIHQQISQVSSSKGLQVKTDALCKRASTTTVIVTFYDNIAASILDTGNVAYCVCTCNSPIRSESSSGYLGVSFRLWLGNIKCNYVSESVWDMVISPPSGGRCPCPSSGCNVFRSLSYQNNAKMSYTNTSLFVPYRICNQRHHQASIAL